MVQKESTNQLLINACVLVGTFFLTHTEFAISTIMHWYNRMVNQC